MSDTRSPLDDWTFRNQGITNLTQGGSSFDIFMYGLHGFLAVEDEPKWEHRLTEYITEYRKILQIFRPDKPYIYVRLVYG